MTTLKFGGVIQLGMLFLPGGILYQQKNVAYFATHLEFTKSFTILYGVMDKIPTTLSTLRQHHNKFIAICIHPTATPNPLQLAHTSVQKSLTIL
jgi:hypothetical protein